MDCSQDHSNLEPFLNVATRLIIYLIQVVLCWNNGFWKVSVSVLTPSLADNGDNNIFNFIWLTNSHQQAKISFKLNQSNKFTEH